VNWSNFTQTAPLVMTSGADAISIRGHGRILSAQLKLKEKSTMLFPLNVWCQEIPATTQHQLSVKDL